MIQYPNIDPVALKLGPLNIHWYGLMYLLGFLGAWLFAHWRVKRYHLSWTSEQISDLIFYLAMGVIVGGRLGYLAFYEPRMWFHDPLIVFRVWQGGMSFHGGFLGVVIALILFSRKIHQSFWMVSDFVAPLVPFGLGAGRLGNFINGELWGRVSDVPWAMIFPMADFNPRHPSQLYELALEGIGLWVLLAWYTSKPRPTGRASALFLMGYALCRVLVEWFREPDKQLGFLAFGWLTMGQLLSIPMFLLGLYLWWVKRDANLFKFSSTCYKTWREKS